MIINDLWGPRPQHLKEDFSPINEDGFNIGDLIIVRGRNQFSGERGQVVDLGRGGHFVVARLADGSVRSFDASDLAPDYDDDEDDDIVAGRHFSDWDSDDLDEHGGGIGPRQHWQKLMRETDAVNQMDQDELEDDTDLTEARWDPQFLQRKNGLILWQINDYHYAITQGTQPFDLVKGLPDTSHEEAEAEFRDMTGQRLDERAGPVTVIRWGKPWSAAGGDGARATGQAKQAPWSDTWSPEYKGDGPAPNGYSTDYTQDNPNFQGDAHHSELETFYDYDGMTVDLEFDGYDIPNSEDPQGIQTGSDCELVTYKTAKPTMAQVLAPDPEAPGTQGAEDDADDADEELFTHDQEEETHPYDLGYPNKGEGVELSWPQDGKEDDTEEDAETDTVKIAESVMQGVERRYPNLFLSHTDSEIGAAAYSVADTYAGSRITESDIGIMARQVLKMLKS